MIPQRCGKMLDYVLRLCVGWNVFSFFAKLAEQMSVQMDQYRRTMDVCIHV